MNKLYSDYTQRLWSKIFRQSDLMKKVKDWLQEVVDENQHIVDAQENGEDCVTTDGSDDFYIGYHQCSESLLIQIDKWEKEDAENDR